MIKPAPFFSVIIPVYKAEAFLDECVKSVLLQTFDDYELILVDDGSPDNCPAICDEYAKKESRIAVIHKANGGASSARNVGIKAGKGKYLLFIDSDDFYSDKEFFNKLHNVLTKKDAPQLLHFLYSEYHPQTDECKNAVFSQDINLSLNGTSDMLAELIKNDSLFVSPWSFAFSREFIINNSLYFAEGIKSEDIEWGMRVFNLQPTIQIIDERAYVWRMQEDSVTHSIDAAHMQNYMDILKKFAYDFEYRNDEIKRVLLGYMAYQFSVFCGLLHLLNKDEQKQFLKDALQLKWLLKYASGAKAKLVKKLCGLIGLRLTVKVLNFYLKHR
ncbi:MAG: glycosyltransferase [Oscillospiraceae bacterium]|jgi:glycosyltransferase involved in cell wall biosynthesis|nr:glycosyltransferase [Oscillospiraceae bacterium]